MWLSQLKKIRLRYFCICMMIFAGVYTVAMVQSQEQQEQEGLRLGSELVGITGNWASGKASTPGMRVEILEVMRIEEQGKLMVQYHIFLKGAPKDQLYKSFNWPVNLAEPSETMRGLTLRSDGLVICAGRTPEQCGSSDKKDDPVEFTFLPVKGEIYREALVSEDGNTKVFFAIIPDPIISTDKGCTIEAIRIQPKFETAMLRGKGFKANENLLFTAKSYEEEHQLQVKADNNGEFVMSLMPFVKGKESGKTDLKLKGANCAPSISFEWGK